MPRPTGDRAPAFFSEELEKLMEDVLPLYEQLYGAPEEPVNTHQKKGIWLAIARKVQTLWVHSQWSIHCKKQWDNLRPWARKTASAGERDGAQLSGQASGHGTSSHEDTNTMGPSGLEGQPGGLQEILEKDDVLLCNSEDNKEDAAKQVAYFFPPQKKQAEAKPIERTLAIIRPDLLRVNRDAVLEKIHEKGLVIAIQKEIMLTEDQARLFYHEHEDKEFFSDLIKYMTSGPVLVLALAGEKAVQYWNMMLGPETVEEAKEKEPNSLRAEFAMDDTPINQLHGSSTPEEARRELEFFFPVEHTLAVIKPDALDHKDDILQLVKGSGFTITRMKEITFTPEMAKEIYKEHEEKPFFETLVSSLSAGGYEIARPLFAFKRSANIKDMVNHYGHILKRGNPDIGSVTDLVEVLHEHYVQY
ncbi:thioredoxin domain-containing protein 3 [Pleurodeles waltl]|uniref:thioredoxin domain-containing protein 3 n=1 Tax=Pleurodeles waltl TaxID=8319 RepID=UPI0037093D0D